MRGNSVSEDVRELSSANERMELSETRYSIYCFANPQPNA